MDVSRARAIHRQNGTVYDLLIIHASMLRAYSVKP